MKKKYDLAVKVSSYTASDGNTKGKYQNVGSVMEDDNGGKFILLDRTFNPAGVVNPDNKDSVLISLFAPKQKDGQNEAPAPSENTSSEEIPF